MDSQIWDDFNKSSRYDAPDGVMPTFQIQNHYPAADELAGEEYPWLEINFKEEPKRYLDVVKDYCLLGMPECDFYAQLNQERDWYHAPWFHLPASGREPIHGLTLELPIEPYMLSITQGRVLQNWACGYYNKPAASVFHNVWLSKGPANPNWNSSVSFPRGTVMFKVLASDATNEELPFMKGSPSWEALIAKNVYDPEEREQGTVRFLQLDVATKDSRANNGWIFGTFIYDGRCVPDNEPILITPNPGWRRLLPVGLMWGNDPLLTQKEFDEKGKRPVESWVNPAAEELLRQLKGNRPSLGWNGRMNGPADNFMSACSSCHGVAQKIPNPDPNNPGQILGMLAQKTPKPDCRGQYVPENDEKTMLWFANSGILGPDPGDISGDFCLQLMMGYDFFERKYGKNPGPMPSIPPRSLTRSQS